MRNKKAAIEQQIIGGVATNVYLVINKETKEAFLVDPADQPDYISSWITRSGAMLKGILLTHSHFDHILAVNSLKERYQVPVYAMAAEQELLTDARLNLSLNWSGQAVVVKDTIALQDSQELTLAGFRIFAYHTPGHTKGGACFYLPEEAALFSGDTIFCQSIGRTDLPTGNMRELVSSLRRMLSLLPDDTVIYPGHEAATTAADEKQFNPYL